MARLAFDLTVLRVLFVVDDTFAREFEVTAFQHLGIKTITTARDGAEAIDALERGVPCDLLALDWNMPLFDGAELAQAVHARWPGISLLMLTNNEGLDQIEAAREAGVDGCLIKPFSLGKLREAIQLALISRLTGGGAALAVKADASPASPELAEVTASIQSVLDAADGASGPNGSPDSLRDANRLAEKLSNQLTGFVGSLDTINAQQLAVIRLHADCVQAVLSGRPELLAHETQNLIVDGLSFAVDLVSE